jgi:hypothetical protein
MYKVRGGQPPRTEKKVKKKLKKPLDKLHQVWYNKNVKRNTSYRNKFIDRFKS